MTSKPPPASIGAPEHLRHDHDLATFDSGEPELDEWLRDRALPNEREGASRTYVVSAGGRVVGYYALANSAVARDITRRRVGQGMPKSVPVMLLARLAVDREYQGQGIGPGLLKDAASRTLQAADLAGIRAILVHAISERAKRFYEKYGFVASNIERLTLMMTVADARKNFPS